MQSSPAYIYRIESTDQRGPYTSGCDFLKHHDSCYNHPMGWMIGEPMQRLTDLQRHLRCNPLHPPNLFKEAILKSQKLLTLHEMDEIQIIPSMFRYGFETIKMLRRWFADWELKQLHDNGYKLGMYELIPGGIFMSSPYQTMFYVEHVADHCQVDITTIPCSL